MTLSGIDAIARSLLTGLADAAVRSLILAAIVGAGLAIFRVRNATDRLAAWRLVLVAALVMPLVSVVMPGLLIPVPSFSGSPGTFGVLTVQADATSVVTAPDGWTLFRLTPAGAALGLYAVGVFWLLTRALRGWLAARRLDRQAQPVGDDAVADRAAVHARAVGLAQPPRIAQVTDDVLNVPVTFGVRRPVVLLPESWRTWPDAQLDAVLIHELSHISRRDAFTQHLAISMRAAFWPSPLGWWLRRHVTRLAEEASDEAALARGVEPARYADILLGFLVLVRNRSGRAPATLAMARVTGAERRVEHVLEWKGSRSMSLSTRTSLALAATAAAIVALVAAIHPVPVSAAPVALPDAPALIQLPPPPPPAPPAPTAPPAPPAPTAEPPAPAPPAQSVHQQQPPPPPPPPPPHPAPPPPPPPPPPMPDWNDLIPNDDFAKDAYTITTQGIRPAVAVNHPIPKYTSEAMRAKVQGVVPVQVIIEADGTISKARVIKSLHQDLDEQALIAVRQWTFRPATLDGRAVPMATILVMEFRLH